MLARISAAQAIGEQAKYYQSAQRRLGRPLASCPCRKFKLGRIDDVVRPRLAREARDLSSARQVEMVVLLQRNVRANFVVILSVRA
jgi:hypothetical protein